MRVAVVVASAACVVVAYACGGFGEADDEALPSEDSGANDAPAIGDATSDVGSDVDADRLDGGPDAASAIGTHPPACPRPAGPTCAPATCTLLTLYQPATPGVEFPFGLETDSNYVYWAAMSAGTDHTDPYNGEGISKIMRVDRSGALNGAKATILATNQARAYAVTIAGDYLYWAALNKSNASELRRIRRDCGANCVTDVMGSLGPGFVLRLVTLSDTTLLAVNNANDVRLITLGATVASASIIANANLGSFTSVTPTSTHALITGGISTQVRIAAAGAAGSTQIGTVPDAGADAGLTPGLAPTTTDCNFVFGGRGRGQFWKIAVDGGTAQFFANTASNMLTFDVAADQTHLWIAAPNGFGIWTTEIASGLSTQVIQGANVHRIAVDDVGVYWGEHDVATAGPIHMLKKK